MLWAVFRVEWRSALRERAAWAVIAAFAALVVYAALGGWSFVRAENSAMEGALKDDAARLSRLREEVVAIAGGAEVRHVADPRSPSLVGGELAPRVAALPPGPLAVVAVGQRDLLPQAILVTTKARSVSSGRDDGESPMRRSSGPFDLAFVFVFLLPLMVIALSYDLLAGERERGTLALVLSQPVSLATFVLGKALQRAALLIAVVLVLGLLAPMIAGGTISDPGGPLRLALYAGLLIVYTAFWLTLAVAVNAWGRSSAGNALSLVGIWLALLVVVPGLASVAVDTLHPSPSRVELINLAREAAREAESRSSVLEGNHGKTPGTEELGRRAIEVQSAFERQVAPVVDRFREQHARQQAMVDQLRFLSPAILLHEGLSDVAGSSVGRHQDFSAQVDRFHDALKGFFHERTERAAALTPADYDAMPRFSYRERPDAALAGRVAVSLGALGLACAALIALALVGLKRTLSRGLR